ncbi:iron-sulfur cluster assembly accessory protein [Alteromonas aestuariivivens]|uniref:Iron-sulfur cluster assembly accessory protein n=1 Tax=Alteromonas aestuariivivens TaxID=1938339 RepID=A0A3D8MET6_9ALTE|nr:iron-sulfur cluster assembly accessory protein [Alteromonas aestuariivivens]RDV29272.1 iron-sulfur cluster assembly accessory protein [Alteromonas aestuariivivens]
MTVETFVPSTSVVTLTDSAIKHFEKKLSSQPGKCIRLSTKLSGCTGYAYVLDFADAPQAGDEIIAASPTLTVAVAEDAVDLLRNTEIDYVMEGVNGVIKYHNPNVVDECGCGESFNVG